MELPGKPPLARPPLDPPDWAVQDPAIVELLKSRPGWTVAALTGGIATGKSVVSELFDLLGTAIIDLDVLARAAVEPDTSAFQATVKLLGPQVVTAEGGLNRALIARKVFKDAALRQKYEDIIHPVIWALMSDRLRELAGAPDPPGVVIVVVPLLFEVRLHPLFEPIILCFTSTKIQLERLRKRPGLGYWSARARLKSQLPAGPKIPQSQFIIDNQGPLSLTIRQVKAIRQKLLSWKPA